MRELVLAGLLVDVKQLHVNAVTLLQASFLNGLEALPVNLGDVHESLLARQDLNETAVRHDALDGAVINLTYLRNGHDSLDLCHCSVDGALVRGGDLNLAHAICLLDVDCRAGILLHLLDDLSARSDYSADELLRNGDHLNARNLWLEVGPWLAYGVGQAVEDVLSAGLGLCQRLLEDLIGESVALDIHLGCGKSVTCAGGLEVHVSEVVLVTEDVGKDSVLLLTRVLDKSHCDTRYWLLHRNSGIHQRERAGADSGH